MGRIIATSRFILGIFSSVFFCCGNDVPVRNRITWSSDDYYDIRLNNILRIPEIQEVLKSAPCIDVIVLQPTACNECSKYKIQEVLDTVNAHAHHVHFLFVADSLDQRYQTLAGLLDADKEHIHLLERKEASSLGLDLPEIMQVSFCDHKVVAYHIFSGDEQVE